MDPKGPAEAYLLPLVDLILPYVQIETVTEPCQLVFIETPDGVAMGKKKEASP